MIDPGRPTHRFYPTSRGASLLLSLLYHINYAMSSIFKFRRFVILLNQRNVVSYFFNDLYYLQSIPQCSFFVKKSFLLFKDLLRNVQQVYHRSNRLSSVFFEKLKRYFFHQRTCAIGSLLYHKHAAMSRNILSTENPSIERNG